jgi:ribosomal protein L37AE/L43A
MKFVYCSVCGTARDHDNSVAHVWQCLSCGQKRAPLDNSVYVRIENYPQQKHYDEINIQERLKRHKVETQII